MSFSKLLKLSPQAVLRIQRGAASISLNRNDQINLLGGFHVEGHVVIVRSGTKALSFNLFNFEIFMAFYLVKKSCSDYVLWFIIGQSHDFWRAYSLF